MAYRVLPAMVLLCSVVLFPPTFAVAQTPALQSSTATTKESLPENAHPYYAYWLTPPHEVNPNVSSGYSELLLTRRPLQELKDLEQPGDRPVAKAEAFYCAVYERDTVFSGGFLIARSLRNLRPDAKTVVLNDVPHTYEAADLKDVLRLLKNPMGEKHIGLHRITAPLIRARAEQEMLIRQIGAFLDSEKRPDKT